MGKLRVCSRRHLTGFRHCPSCGTVRWDHVLNDAAYRRGYSSTMKAAVTTPSQTPAVRIPKPGLLARIAAWIKQIFQQKGQNT